MKPLRPLGMIRLLAPILGRARGRWSRGPLVPLIWRRRRRPHPLPRAAAARPALPAQVLHFNFKLVWPARTAARTAPLRPIERTIDRLFHKEGRGSNVARGADRLVMLIERLLPGHAPGTGRGMKAPEQSGAKLAGPRVAPERQSRAAPEERAPPPRLWSRAQAAPMGPMARRATQGSGAQVSSVVAGTAPRFQNWGRADVMRAGAPSAAAAAPDRGKAAADTVLTKRKPAGRARRDAARFDFPAPKSGAAPSDGGAVAGRSGRPGGGAVVDRNGRPDGDGAHASPGRIRRLWQAPAAAMASAGRTAAPSPTRPAPRRDAPAALVWRKEEKGGAAAVAPHSRPRRMSAAELVWRRPDPEPEPDFGPPPRVSAPFAGQSESHYRADRPSAPVAAASAPAVLQPIEINRLVDEVVRRLDRIGRDERMRRGL